MDFFAANVFLIILHATKLTQRGLNRFNDHATVQWQWYPLRDSVTNMNINIVKIYSVVCHIQTTL